MGNPIVSSVQQAIEDLMANPFGVRNPDGSKFLVLDAASRVPPATLIAMANGAAAKQTINLMGGCSQMGPEDKQAMLDFFGQAFQGVFAGTLLSGATRDVQKQTSADAPLLTDPMVTDVPTLVARLNPGCVALGTAPKVRDVMAQMRGRGLMISDYSYLNWDYDLVVVVQQGVEETAEWDGDLALRAKALEMLRTLSKHRTGAIAWNGGGVTGKEIIGTVKSGDPIVLIEGSGRKTDELIKAFLDGNWSAFEATAKPTNVHIVNKGKPLDLRSTLHDLALAA